MSEETTEGLPSAWYDSLPGEIQELPYFRRSEDGRPPELTQVIADITGIAKMQGNMSETHVKIPPPDASEEQQREYIQKAVEKIPGIMEAKSGEKPPKEPEGYKIPEGMDPEGVKAVREFAHKHQWGQDQFTEFVDRMAGEQKSAQDNQMMWQEQQKSILNEKLGAAREEHLARTAAALADYAPEGFIDQMMSGKLDANVVMMLDGLVHKMVEMGDEQSQFVRQVHAGARTLTPDEHRSKAMEIMGQLREMRAHDVGYEELNAKRMEHIAAAGRH